MLENPALIHRWDHTHSILSICAFPSKNLLFAGTQDSKILVVDKRSYNIVRVLQLGDNSTEISNSPPLSSSSNKNNTIKNTRSSVLCLDKSLDEKYLFSAGADSLVRVWSVEFCRKDGSLQIKEVATVYSATDIGDIFSIKYLDSLQTLVFGCQNASLLYLDNILDRIHGIDNNITTKDKNNLINISQTNLDKLPNRRYDKFFDSLGPTGSASPLIASSRENLSKDVSNINLCDGGNLPHAILEIPAENIVRYAHNGFIYSIVMIPSNVHLNGDDLFENNGKNSSNTTTNKNTITESIISASGDGVSNIWTFTKDKKDSEGKVFIELIGDGMDNDDGVFSQAIEFPFLYCGSSDGVINIWDLNTRQLVSQLNTPSKLDISSISVYQDHIFAIHEEGITLSFEDQFIHWNPKQGKLLSSEIFIKGGIHGTNQNEYASLVAGGNDGSLTLWNLSNLFQNQAISSIYESKTIPTPTGQRRLSAWNAQLNKPAIDTDDMLSTLRKLIQYQSVSQSSDTSYKMASSRCATFLHDLFIKLGAVNVRLLPVRDNHNPVILANFKSQRDPPGNGRKKKILWYGHYDVIAAGDSNRWNTEPFSLTCENGYLKGRGVSDNKGPLVSAIYSVATLYQQGNLINDIVFLVEGDEESGSPGFKEVCEKYRASIGGDDIDWIFLSNSSWVDQEHPCLNYGLRGVINAEVKVWSDKHNGHSGINGGVYREPTFDLINIISKLQDSDGHILIPEFSSSIKDIEPEEHKRFQNIIDVANVSDKEDYTIDYLVKNWTKPSLSVTSMNVSGPGNITVIPKVAWMGISIRLVPEQSVTQVRDNLIKHINDCFKQLHSSNHIKVTILNEADAWLGDPSNHAYKILREELTAAWDMEPLFVREGGSIPCIRTLERCFRAPAVQIPCGQSTDNAHLDNENLRIQNWTTMTEILSKVFNRL